MSSAPQRVYCAGPLFNQGERDEMSAIADVLCQAGFEVYLPHRDGMEFRHILACLTEQGHGAAQAGQFLHAAIFALDVFQLVEECQLMVWNLNGRVPDEGAVSEAAMAWMLGKPLVAYKDDVRTLIAGRDNPLLAGLVDFSTVSVIGDIVPALRRAAATGQPVASVALPPAVQRAVDQGRELWTVMKGQDAFGDNARIAEVVATLFGESTCLAEPSAASNPNRTLTRSG